MNSSEVGVWIGILAVVVAIFSSLVIWVRIGESQDEKEALLAQGRRLAGVLEQVGPAHKIGQSSQRVSFFGCRATFVFETPDGPLRVETTMYVPETALHLFQAGARCEAIVDSKTPERLCVVSLHNTFGIAAPVHFASSHFVW